MTKTIDISAAREHLDDLVKTVVEGDEIVILKDQKPVARMIPVQAENAKRIAGLGKGDAWISADFDAPLDDAFWMNAK
jgi:prevent-host-death family protein